MALSPERLAPALALYRQRDLPAARTLAEALLAEEPDAPAALEFAGVIARDLGDQPAAVDRFRRLVEATNGASGARFYLASQLIAGGELNEAATVCQAGGRDPNLLRLLGYVHQQRGELDAAIDAYRTVVAAFPQDFHCWNNLGNALSERGDYDGASEALDRAISLNRDAVPIYINLSEVLAKADRSDVREKLMMQAATVAPNDPAVHVELGLARAGQRDRAGAEESFREAIRLTEGFSPAHLELGLLLENQNRVDDLETLVAEADAQKLDEPEIEFLRAWLLRRQGRIEEALPLAERTPLTVNPIRRAQLLAELYDRLGEPAKAFPYFEDMNAAAVQARPAPPGPTYRELVTSEAALITPERVAAWSTVSVPSDPPSPVFIVGFPRSGTTLLDTLLMNLPGLHVLEELPVLRQAELALGGEDRLATLTSDEAAELRATYWRALDEQAPPPAPGRTVVDKFPLHMARLPLIHRIFPDAKIVLVERHPCDAVLSCFMSNFQLNLGMRSFTSLEEAARTYDTVFDAWTRATDLLPVNVHRIRYERMIDDLEGEMRPLLDFLGIAWDPRVLDNRGSAAKREHIRTASYSQVSEPLYRRALGRWERYRPQLQPILPILAPWAERMGYPM